MAGDNTARNRVWADWPITQQRDRVLRATFQYLGIEAAIQLAESGHTGHGRLLEITWASGKKLAVRLDQGVSYWRAAYSRQAGHFDLNSGDADVQGKYLAELVIGIEGAQMPTQLFLKVRNG
jgi:hypothetical protein